ncbi:hypothetical protein ABFX02_04G047100 [Erythranthe guttata]
MRNLSKPKQENRFSSPKSMNHPLPSPPRISRGSLENVRLAGRSVGASMVVDGGGGGSGESCSINIYVNNDVQGISNCVLIGSEVSMGDPGVSLYLEDLKMDRGFRIVNKKMERDSAAFWVLLVILLVLVIPILAYLIV